MIVAWPAKLKGNKTFTRISSSLDIFATALNVAGDNPAGYDVDGKSLIPYLSAKNNSANMHEALYWHKD